MTAKQVLTFLFGPADQARAQRKLPVGMLDIAQNIRQVKDGEPRKRLGFKRTAPSFVGASWTNLTSPSGMVPGPNSTMFALDGDERAWAYDPDTTTWRSRGRLKRVMPSNKIAMPATLAVNPGEIPCQPVEILVGGDIWVFAPNGATIPRSGYTYTIFDATTGVEKFPPTTLATSFNQLAAVYNGTSVWLFLALGTTQVASHKFSVASPGSLPTTAVYQTIGGATLLNVDAHYHSSSGDVVVLASGINAGTYWYSHSILDQATGAAKVSPAPVTTTATPANTSRICNGSILVHAGANGHAYYAIWFNGSVANQFELRLVDVTLSTLAASNQSLTTVTDSAASTSALGITSGYVAGNGDRVVFAQSDTLAATIRPDQYRITRYTYNGSTVATLGGGAGCWLASKPQAIGSNWYVMGAHDDGRLGSAGLKNEGIQRTFFLLDSNLEYVSRAMWGEASALLMLPSTLDPPSPSHCFVTPMVAVGSALLAGVTALKSSKVDQTAATLTWDTAPNLAPLVVVRDKAIAPGGIVTTWSHEAPFRELVPMLSPSWISVSAGGTTYNVAAVYRFTDANGTITRSAPIVGSLSINNGATVTIPTLRALLPATKAEIEFYAGLGAAGPFLQVVLATDPTSDTMSFTFSSTLLTDETLYTVLSGISNEPAPPARCAAAFVETLFLSGTDEPGAVWRSHELTQGFGPTFDSSENLSWTDGTGDVLTMAAVDFNLLALFKGNAVGVFRRGATVVQTLKGPVGARNPFAAFSSRPGVLFQVAGTLRVFVVTPGMELADVGQGIEDHTAPGALMYAGAYDASEEQTRLYLSTGKVAVLDHANLTPEMPVGQWYVWTSANLPVAYGACTDSTGVVRHLEADGTIRYQDQAAATWVDAKSAGSDPVLVKLQTGKLSLFGPQQRGRVSDVLILGQQKGACDFRLTAASGSLSSNHDVTLSGSGDLQLNARPPSLLHVQEIQLTLEETANGGGTEGFVPESIALVVQPRGKARAPETAEVI